MRYLLLLLSTLMLISCTATPPLPVLPQEESYPAWVEVLPQQSGALYSKASVEVVDTPRKAKQQAKQQATNQLKQQLQSAVQQQRTKQIKLSLHDAEARGNLQQEIYRRTPLVSPSHVEVVASYLDEGKGYFHALARLDIDQEVTSAKQQAQRFDRDIEQESKALSVSHGQALKKMQGATKLLGVFERRHQLHEMLKWLQPGGEGVPLTKPLQRIEQDLLHNVASIPISISPLSGYGIDTTISQVLTEQLSRRGLVVVSGDGQLQLQYSLQQENRYQDDRYHVTIEGLLQLNDMAGKTLMSLKVSGEGMDSSEIMAIQLALTELGKQAAGEVVEVLISVGH